ncbi:nitroreductase family protein [Carboxylicivirga taeanensis]|uniref:nitroreductase family protein n=1 Tax=Carboxylicivirga taeanensis TaxID=1416875 RepID=UPI003F6DCB25
MTTILTDNCCNCLKCEKICPVSGINIDSKTINDECIECHHCGAICKTKAIHNEYLLGHTTQNTIQPYEFEQLMQQRRSHRNFSNRKIAPEIIAEFIENLRFSPTASNQQSLQFTVVTNPDKLLLINKLTITTLSKAFGGINAFTKPLLKLFLGNNKLSKMEQAKQKFMNKKELNKQMICYNAPALILVHSETTPTGMPCHDANIWTGMAILYAELIDLCTCINGYIVNAAKRNKSLKNTVNIPDTHTIYSALLIGYPKNRFENKVDRPTPIINTIT